MAAGNSLLLKCPVNLVFFRYLQSAKHSLRTCQYSTSKLSKKSKPVKFTESSAAKMSIADTTGLYGNKLEDKVKKFLVLSSLGVFLVYFCVLREENDVDEILSGSTNYRGEAAELVDLKIKLAYCEKVNLPTAKLKARIEEIEAKNYRPVFLK